ncbi:hypothetical protein TNCV_785761 [Trichonephila clavipes]|nr:hypothetical protein TNCV_785761 [Trichonephila clavipes]
MLSTFTKNDAAVITRKKIVTFSWEVLHHPPYSPKWRPLTINKIAREHVLTKSASSKTSDGFDDVKTGIKDFFTPNFANLINGGFTSLQKEVISNSDEYRPF